MLVSGIERSVLLWEKMAQNRRLSELPKLGTVSEIWNIGAPGNATWKIKYFFRHFFPVIFK
jgi:hypothetical protein